MTTPQDIIRAWCASCGMAEPSNGDCMALVAAVRAEPLEALLQIEGKANLAVSMCDTQGPADGFRVIAAFARHAQQTSYDSPISAKDGSAELLVSAYRLTASLTGDQSLLVMELANRFARLSGKSAGDAQ